MATTKLLGIAKGVASIWHNAMQLSEILSSQIIRLIRPLSRLTGNPYALSISRAFESKYGFLEGPRNVADFNINNGITFVHGYFDDRIVIDRLQIFSDGLVCHTKASTDDGDAFIDDAVQWARAEAGLFEDEPADPIRAYVSHLEVSLSVAIDDRFSHFESFQGKLEKMLLSYGQESRQFSMTGRRFHVETAATDPFAPPKFIVERRAGKAHETATYFSSAPLRTGDHLAALETLEVLLKA